jgi:hypothetical protein
VIKRGESLQLCSPHPTLGESIGMAAELARGSCTVDSSDTLSQISVEF